MLPRLSYYAGSSETERYVELMGKNIAFILIASLGMIPMMVVCAEPIVLIMGGDGFIESAKPLIAISPGVLLVCLNTALAQHLVSNGFDRQFAFINLLGLVSVYILNFVLIPPLGIVGAALSSAGAELVVLLPKIWYSRDMLRKVMKHLRVVVYLLSSACATICAAFALFSCSGADAIIRLSVSVSVFVSIYVLVLCLFREPMIYGLVQRLVNHFIR